MTKLTDEEFMTAYRVTSTRGRLYGRGMLLAAATRTVIARACKVPRQAIGASAFGRLTVGSGTC
jgi:hypothetical protein